MEELRRGLRILVRPGRTWDEVAAAPSEPRPLLARYVVPLAAVPAVCGFIGPLILSLSMASIHLMPDIAGRALQMAATYLLILAAVAILTLWVTLIAPAFGLRRDLRRALNLVGYSGGAAWLSGAFGLYPSLDLSAEILGSAWSLYVLYEGLPAMTRVTEERRLTFFAVILLASLLLAAAVAGLSGWAASLGGPLRVA